MELITSVNNDRVKAAAALARRSSRETERRFLIEGPHPVEEALADGAVETVFCTAELVAAWEGRGATVVPVAPHVLERLADSRTPQGVVAVGRRTPASLTDVVGDGLMVVLDGIADPGNAGAIVRTADASGARAVVFTRGSVDPWNPKAVRGAAGSTTHVALVTDVGLAEVVAACRGAGQVTVGLAVTGGEDVALLETLSGPVALVLGSEAHGLSAGVALDRTTTIPMQGRAESLNLAAAAAVACVAAGRGQQRR